MNKYLFTLTILLGFIVLLSMGCNKQDLLDAKPQSNLALPTTVKDFQSMMDNMFAMNTTPIMGDASSDDYYVTNTLYSGTSFTAQTRNLYTWKSDIYEGAGLSGSAAGAAGDWSISYSQVFTANLVIEGINSLKNVSSTDQAAYNDVKGQAYFFRASAFFQIAQLYAPPYDNVNSKSDLGIPLRLLADVNIPTTRSTVQQTYEQILSDLNEARLLLKPSVPLTNKNRPSKPAAFGLLARTYLSMRNYQKAGEYADSSLRLYNSLLDYNTLPASTVRYSPFNFLNNPEVIFNSYQQNANGYIGALIISYLSFNDNISVDTSLYRSYNANDLRSAVFFYKRPSGAINLNGTYSGTTQLFSGIATDEMYLIRAESFARSGNAAAALSDLNSVLSKRYKTNTYTPYQVATTPDPLQLVLSERRKEMPFRDVRWMDLRRLNKEGANITLRRIINGQTFTLPPNDPRYVLPIPLLVIQYSGIQQNQR